MGFVTDKLGITGRGDKDADKGTEAFEQLDLPGIEDMQLELKELVRVGKYTPEEAETFFQQATGLQDYQADPAATEAQYTALQGLTDTVESGGLDAQARSNLSQIKSNELDTQRGSREAILADARARGVGGTGLELGSSLLNQQESASRSAQEGFNEAALAEQRRQEALMSLAETGSSIRGQGFDEAAATASAQDAINQFNTQNQQAQENLNVNTGNEAELFNLQEKQRIADQNIDIANQEQQYNKELEQQNFGNQVTQASGISGAAANAAQVKQADSAVIGNLIGSGTSAAAVLSDENKKTDISNFDAEEFLNSITGYKYRYKKDPEVNAGVMAQDLEQTPEGDAMVEETSQGKVIDYGKGFNTMMAALAHLHEKVKELEG